MGDVNMYIVMYIIYMYVCMYIRINSWQVPGMLRRSKPGTRPWTKSCRRVIRPLKRPWLVLPVIRTLEHYALSGARWDCQKLGQYIDYRYAYGCVHICINILYLYILIHIYIWSTWVICFCHYTLISQDFKATVNVSEMVHWCGRYSRSKSLKGTQPWRSMLTVSEGWIYRNWLHSDFDSVSVYTHVYIYTCISGKLFLTVRFLCLMFWIFTVQPQ